ncbi:MAG: histidinol-phosphate transaminase [Pseudomonadota bacterium]
MTSLAAAPTAEATPVDKIAAMAPYALADLSAPRGVAPVSLAQNESALPPSPLALEAAARALAAGALYPDPDWTDLRAAVAEVHGLDPAAILCGAGSMELIGALAHAYLGPGRRALTTEYAYLFFRTATGLAGGAVDIAPEADLTVDVDALLSRVRAETAVVFVANPGNPTGNRIAASELRRLRRGLPDRVLLVIDEAYAEFAEAPGETLFDLAASGATVILRTFSKAYALAGMRVGWGVFPAVIGGEVRKVLNPNNISGPAQAAAAAAMRDQAHMRGVVQRTAAIRDGFIAGARETGLSLADSFANFALLRFPNAAAAEAADQALRAEGLLMRGMGGYGLPECLRATIAEDDAMHRALNILSRRGATL